MSFFFIEFSNDHFTPQPWKVVDEKFAVAMVGFVHECPSGISFGVLLKPLALFVLGSQSCFHRPDDDRRDLTNRKAAFMARLFALGMDDLRIGRDELDAVTVHYEQSHV